MDRALIVIVCSAVMVAVLHGWFLNKWIYRFLFLFFTRTPRIPVSPRPSEQSNNRVVVETSLLWNRIILQDPHSSTGHFQNAVCNCGVPLALCLDLLRPWNELKPTCSNGQLKCGRSSLQLNVTQVPVAASGERWTWCLVSCSLSIPAARLGQHWHYCPPSFIQSGQFVGSSRDVIPSHKGRLFLPRNRLALCWFNEY